jgi:ribose/xylose/arabinose/galactoside ABC-type transport system permease subunit
MTETVAAQPGQGMTPTLTARIASKQRFLPLAATGVLFAVAYVMGAFAFPAMRDGQAFFNLLVTTPFLLIAVVGQTFVIISGGIDLSVSGVIALTTVASAALIQSGWNPWLVMPLMLLMGIGIGGVMGFFIAYLKVQPFIATLAGMWFARGLSYVISDSEIRIHDPLYRLLVGTRILIPGLADPVTKKGDYITILVVVAVIVLLAGMYIAQFTRFGRTVYAIGGNNGANEQSSRLMGLSVDRTKVKVYMLNGFCSALAGIAYSIYVGSGHGGHALGFELTVIAAVVIGGTALTGGEGYILGALFGVLITALIQSIIQFNGQLSSWWTSIVIGGLMLVFIGVQALLTNINQRQLARARLGGTTMAKPVHRRRPWYRDKRAAIGAGAAIAIFLGVQLFGLVGGGGSGSAVGPTSAAGCQLKPLRQDQATALATAGAAIVYERNGGGACIDELYAIYPDGRITGDNGAKTVTKQVTPEEVTALVASIEKLGWFTDDMYSTSHTPCAQCYTYFTDVTLDGKAKNVQAVDGGTDAPSNYWLVSGKLSAILPKFDGAS